MTDADKIRQYEAFLHKLALLADCVEEEGIQELINNAYHWSSFNRKNDISELGPRAQKKHAEVLDNLCNTPKMDAMVQLRQKRYEKLKNSQSRTWSEASKAFYPYESDD